MTNRSSYRVSMMAVSLVLMLARSGEAQTVYASRCGTGVYEAEATGTIFFPRDQIFCPLIADPKEPRSFASFLRGTFRSIDDPSGKDTSVGSVGLGDSVGLVRLSGPAAGEGVQLDVVGSIFAQFHVGTPSTDLINADYTIGVPLTFRRSGFSVRARIFHQSSHLGDEELLSHEDVERENLSFEAVEFLVSQEIRAVRAYAGVERLFRREPDTLPSELFHGGVELRTRRARKGQLVAGVDVKAAEFNDWSPAISVRGGMAFGQLGPRGYPGRPILLLLEFYEGPSPYGQFFRDDISYVGVGLHFGL